MHPLKLSFDKRRNTLILVLAFVCLNTICVSESFVFSPIAKNYASAKKARFSNLFGADNDDNDMDNEEQLPLEDLSWRMKKIQLEEAHTRQFLKSKPRKLPYDDARRWVQANIGASTKEEYEDDLAMGVSRTSYIPFRAEEYYTSTGEWISWDHFLGVTHDDEKPFQ